MLKKNRPYRSHHVPNPFKSISPAGKSVFISGASTGIGHCCAIELATMGFQVFAGIRNTEDRIRLHAAHPNLIPVSLEITSEESIRQALNQVSAKLNGNALYGLVNNAGIAVSGPLEFIPVAELRRQMDINWIGHIAVTQAFLPLLRQSRGRIINIGSIAGLTALPFLGPYCASKFALEAITDAMRMELKPWGIQVSIIEPGSIVTPIWQKTQHAAKAAALGLPPEFTELYGHAVTKVRQASERSALKGIAPEAVAKAVIHALTAPKSKTRYAIGTDAHLRRLLNGLPDLVRDWLILTKVGLPTGD